MLSKLPLLRFISLICCKMTKGHLSEIFDGCTTFEEVQLIACKASDVAPIELSLQLKRFKIEYFSQGFG
jgi:hypothetical protein